MTKSVADEIDWTIFDGDPECTCYCRCGKVYRSHFKYYGRISSTVTRKPCSGCGSHLNCYRISSDPETWSVRR